MSHLMAGLMSSIFFFSCSLKVQAVDLNFFKSKLNRLKCD